MKFNLRFLNFLRYIIAIAGMFLSTLATAQTAIDNFNDNSISSTDWTTYSSSPSLTTNETNSRLEFATASNPLIGTNTWNHSEISSRWGIGTTSNIQIQLDVNFVAQVGANLSTSNTGLMMYFSPVDFVASTNGIPDGFGVTVGSEFSNGYNYREIAVIKVVNGVPISLKAFFNGNGTNDFFDTVTKVYAFTLPAISTVYVTYNVSNSQVQLRNSLNGTALPTSGLVGTSA